MRITLLAALTLAFYQLVSEVDRDALKGVPYRRSDAARVGDTLQGVPTTDAARVGDTLQGVPTTDAAHVGDTLSASGQTGSGSPAHRMPVVPNGLLERSIDLRSNIGTSHDAIAGASAEAQRFYDQGLSYLHNYV